MKEIIRALSSLDNILDRKTFKQLGNLVEAILSMTGRVTMLGMSRWSADSGDTILNYLTADVFDCTLG